MNFWWLFDIFEGRVWLHLNHMLALMHTFQIQQLWTVLFYVVLVRKTPLCQNCQRSEMAELSEPARKNCELQKTSLVFSCLLIKCRKNGSILTRGKVFVVKDLLPPFFTPSFFKISFFFFFSDLLCNFRINQKRISLQTEFFKFSRRVFLLFFGMNLDI